MAGSRSALAWFEGCVSCCWHDFSTATAGVESQGMTCSASVGCEISIVISIMRQLFSSFALEVPPVLPVLRVGTQRRLSSFDRDSV